MAGNAADHFAWFQKIGPLEHIPDYITHSVFIGTVLVGLGFIAYTKLKDHTKNVIPSRSLNIATLFELITEFILGLLRNNLGEKDAEKHLAFIATVFIYIFVSNVIGLIPGFQPPTVSLNTNLAVGAFVFIYYNVMGVREHGAAYVKQFMGPVIFLAPLMIIIELIGHVVRPISLSLRLFGNMTGDHMVLNIFSNMVPIGVPVIFLGVGLFVCFIQAFVFSLLSIVYISLAISHDH